MNQPLNKNTNKFAFFGTPSVALDTLRILFEHDYVPTVIITSPDTPQGRGMQVQSTPVALWAEEHGIPVLKPEKLDKEFLEKLSTFKFELNVVVAYGKILPQNIISLPQYGTINIHYSLLPQYRGATPVEQALLNGDTLTGVTIQQMELGLDTGPIISKVEVVIEPNEMKEDLRKKLVYHGAELLIKTLPDIFSGNIKSIPQDNILASHTKKIKKEDGEIDLNGNAKINWGKYRAYENWPGIFFFHDGKRIKITKAVYKNNSFVIEKIIPEGKKEMNYADFLKH